MKYIRTKNNNIWEVLKEDIISFIVNDTYTPLPFDVCVVLKTEVIKQADTIEELCDGDVLFEDGQLKKVHYYKEGFGFNEYGSKLSANQVVVLFIATNKGLIYVARINTEGELVLL